MVKSPQSHFAKKQKNKKSHFAWNQSYIIQNVQSVTWNTELGGSKFYHAQQYPSIPFTICCTSFVSSNIIEWDILLNYRTCFLLFKG